MLERIRHALLRKRRQQVAWWDLVERAEDHLRALDEDNERDWGLSKARPVVDLGAGRILFTRADDTQVSVAVQCVGILGYDGIWTWAWNLPSIGRALQASAGRVRDYGARHGMDRLTTSRFATTEIEAWGLTAAAALIGHAAGAWRLSTPGGYLFLLLGDFPATGASASVRNNPHRLLTHER